MAKKTIKRKTKKKTPVRKKTAKKSRPGKKATARKPKPKKAKPSIKIPKLPAEPIGRVTHYFPKARATAILIEREGVRLGDTLYFKGHTTHFKETVRSLQIDRQPVTQAEVEQEVGIQVKGRTREHDLVFKL